MRSSSLARPEAVPPAIGHNGGPPLDLSFRAFAWRRAHKAAWKTPPRDIALKRLARAERLGLSYREFAGVLMDRGTNLAAIVFAPGAFDPRIPTAAVRQRLAALGGAPVLLCADGDVVPHPAIAAAIGAVAPFTRAAILAFLAGRHLPPLAAFLVGSGPDDHRMAASAGLALYKQARDYFGPA